METDIPIGNDDLSLPKGMSPLLFIIFAHELSRSELQFLAVGLTSPAEVSVAAVHVAECGQLMVRRKHLDSVILDAKP